MEKRDQKKLIISLIYGVIFILILIPVIFKLIPNDSCSDGKQNQDEGGIDCGGVCQIKCEVRPDGNLVFRSTGLTETGISNKYDVYSEVQNTNEGYGSSSFDYTFNLKDENGNILAKRDGTGFLFPKEKKYLIEIGIDSSAYPAKVELEIKNIVWKDFVGVEKPQLILVNKNFYELDQNLGTSDAIGLLRNESPFDFNEIKIQAIVKDNSGNIIALNSTKINTVQSGESREFKVIWPKRIYQVGDMEIQAETNIFKSDAFVKRYFPGQSF